jgi:hypothetical protein
VEPNVVEPIKRAVSEMTNAAEGVGVPIGRMAAGVSNFATRVDERVSRAWRRTSGPTKEEFDRLAEEVRELRARVGVRSGTAKN